MARRELDWYKMEAVKYERVNTEGIEHRNAGECLEDFRYRKTIRKNIGKRKKNGIELFTGKGLSEDEVERLNKGMEDRRGIKGKRQSQEDIGRLRDSTYGKEFVKVYLKERNKITAKHQKNVICIKKKTYKFPVLRFEGPITNYFPGSRESYVEGGRYWA